MSAFDLPQYLESCQQQVNQRLEFWLKQQNGLAPRLVDAMTYATFNGGKRVRPVLAYAAAKAVGGDPRQAGGGRKFIPKYGEICAKFAHEICLI